MYFYNRVISSVFTIIGSILLVLGLILGIKGGIEIATGTGVPALAAMLHLPELLVAGGVFLGGLLLTAIGQMLDNLIDISRNTDETVELLQILVERSTQTKNQPLPPNHAAGDNL